MSITNPIHILISLLDAVVTEDGQAKIDGAVKRFVLIAEGKTTLRQELITAILRAKQQAKRMSKLASTLEGLAIKYLGEGATIQEGAHSLELDERGSPYNSYEKASKKLAEMAGVTDLRAWMVEHGFSDPDRTKPALRIDGRLQ